MSAFRITNEVKEVFRSDLERFHRETHRALERLLADPCPTVGAEALGEAARFAHTLKGLSAMVGAEGLSCWGADLERLWEVAGSFLQSSRNLALEVVSFVCEQLPAWQRMNELTLGDNFAEALEIYTSLRSMMAPRWGDYLKESPEDVDEPSHPESAKNNLQPEARRPALLSPSLLRRNGEEVTRTAAEFQAAHPVPGEKNRVIPALIARPGVVSPVLRQKSADGGDTAISENGRIHDNGHATRPQLIPPTLLRSTPPADSATESSLPSPPLRSKKKKRFSGRKDPAAEIGSYAGVDSAGQKTEELARNVAPEEEAGTPVAHEASAEAQEEADAPMAEDDDLQALLRDEIAGYLTELASLLVTIAAKPELAGGWEEARRLFHTIKGSAATVGIESVALAAKRGEAQCLVAAEEAKDRNRESVEVCIARATEVAGHFGLPFSANIEHGKAPSTSEVSVEPLPETELLSFFTEEALENVAAIESAVLLWERGVEPAEQIAATQRAFHTIKGAANSIGLTRLGSSVHEAEAAMDQARTGSLGTTGLFACLLQFVDQVRGYIKKLEARTPVAWAHDWARALAALQPAEGAISAAPEPGTSAEAEAGAVARPAPSADDDRQLLRVDNSRLHRLFDLVGEMVTDRSRLRQNIERIRALEGQLAERNQSLATAVATFQQQFEFNLLKDRTSPRGAGSQGSGPQNWAASSEFSELEFDRYDQFSILSRTLVELAHDIESVLGDIRGSVETFGADDVRFTQTSRLLQGEITGLGMVPFSALYPRLQRAFRDAAHSVGKKADLIFEGAGVQVDKVLTDRVYAPLLHLLRNAVAHGIEDAASRESLGKPARGQVRLSTSQSANQIVITLSDDGSGLKLTEIRARAIERGLLPADAPTITTAQALDIIFQRGFSTSTDVNSVSGRGVGMDVVRQEIESLSGAIEYSAIEGQGATWTIRLPLSVSITEAIIAECAGVECAFPLNFVESGAIVDATTYDSQGVETYLHHGQSLPVVRLSELLRLPATSQPDRGVVVAVGGRRAVFLLDRVIARREIVVKNFDVLVRQHPLLTGATLDTEGRVIPILNVPALLTYHDSPASRRTLDKIESGDVVADRSGTARVLIVDDSLSVRKVQERFLSALGCEVTSASDGLDAMEKLRENRFDIVFTDLEMPRMNGYELIAEIRTNPLWAKTPVAVVSSRGADKYINKAMAMGANTFLSKPFTEQQLSLVLSHYAGWDRQGFSRTKALAA